MNILKKDDQSKVAVFGDQEVTVSKREKFSWASTSSAGTFCMVPKGDLNIDGTYQREQVSDAKVREIAKDWDWRLFGALSVIMRDDGSLWVYDGGHRCRASFLRDDVLELPCMIFECESIEEEAKAFVGTNTMKSTVSAYHKHRAALKAKEPEAMAVQAVLDKYGYKAMQYTGSAYGFTAIRTLGGLLSQDPELAEGVFGLCAEASEDGALIPGEVLSGLFLCAKRLEGKAQILKNPLREKLKVIGTAGLDMAIRREKHIVGRGGQAVAAKAILDLINKGKRRRLIFS